MPSPLSLLFLFLRLAPVECGQQFPNREIKALPSFRAVAVSEKDDAPCGPDCWRVTCDPSVSCGENGGNSDAVEVAATQAKGARDLPLH